jgi:hypothetical protein
VAAFGKKLAGLDDEKLQSLLTKYDTAGGYFDERGKLGMSRFAGGREQKVRDMLAARGMDPDAFNSMEDFGSSTFSEAGAGMAQDVAGQFQMGRGKPRPRPGVFGKQTDKLRAENRLGETTDYYNQNVEPQFEQISAQLQQLQQQDALSQEYVTAARSGIAQTVKGAEEDRLKRVGAVLGLRGLDASSPAAAALGVRAALDADTELANSLRDFGMQVETINQQSRERELGLAQDLVTRRMAAFTAATAGDYDRLYSLSNDISSLMEAIRGQKELEELQADLAREAAGESRMGQYIDYGVKGLGLLAAPFTGGASLAATFGGSPMGWKNAFGGSPGGANATGVPQNFPRPTGNEAGW